MAYTGHNGVRYSRWSDDTETIDEPDTDQTDAVLDELYFSKHSGTLNVTVDTADGYLHVEVPVKADPDWNKFVESLPQWE